MTERQAGDVVAGSYRLRRRIGEGGMGEVWEAEQTITRRTVALKFLKRDSAEKPDVRRRFLREARAACAVEHPNVVAIHDVLELDDGAPVMVMEYLRGESLQSVLDRENTLDLHEVAAILLRVVSAVGSAHELGIVHRDLKPDNIFLAETPAGTEVKVLDFGIAKLTATEGETAETGGLTQTGAMLGTPHYMSPEQAFGERHIDHRADIWALGVILYRVLSGELPTKGDNLGQILRVIMTNSITPIDEIAPSLPEDVRGLIGRMLNTERTGRPDDLHEVQEVLARHTDRAASVESFGAPAAELMAEARSDPGTGGERSAKTNDGGNTPAAVVRSSVEVKAPPRWPIALGAAALLGVVVAIALQGNEEAEAETGEQVSTVSEDDPTLENQPDSLRESPDKDDQGARATASVDGPEATPTGKPVVAAPPPNPAATNPTTTKPMGWGQGPSKPVLPAGPAKTAEDPPPPPPPEKKPGLIVEELPPELQ